MKEPQNLAPGSLSGVMVSLNIINVIRPRGVLASYRSRIGTWIDVIPDVIPLTSYPDVIPLISSLTSYLTGPGA